MNEPSRIGLTSATGAQLDELLEDLNPDSGDEGVKLIKFDLYRLAVALRLKANTPPPPLPEKSVTNLRVKELDPDGLLFLAAENSNLLPAGTPIYEFIEQLAEAGISDFYRDFQQTGQLPFNQYFGE
ncbi:hypothetical protein [Endozoicomonas numazuensis]|uniref:Uncharacterized protein n=1 Tax=Endozoicomonas numazuensis TaxID=1137799 RepID=A0A081NHC4_9GAMM|nr:hypothetical protein [Endozoicomonas numazuensis]KEQ17847.1 hypothetical protein GZ78_09340 [Endozoicomonas numazuensis]